MIIKRVHSQLPIWPDAVRGAPNALLRSAFFAGIHSKKRRTLGEQQSPDVEPEGTIVASQDGITLRYAGTQLNQYDADVFFEVLHRSRRERLGAEAYFAGYSFLKAIGRDDSKSSYQDLDNSLRRLKRGTLDVVWSIGPRPYVYVGSLIDTYTREATTKAYRITLSPEMLSLFQPSSWTQIEWAERMKLKGKPLAQWLHSYFSTHARPFPVTVAFLKEKTGSPTTQMFHFRVELRNAFKAMQDILGWTAEWSGDVVKLTRPPTKSQERHILKTGLRKTSREEATKTIKAKESRRAIEAGLSQVASWNHQHLRKQLDVRESLRDESKIRTLFDKP